MSTIWKLTEYTTIYRFENIIPSCMACTDKIKIEHILLWILISDIFQETWEPVLLEVIISNPFSKQRFPWNLMCMCVCVTCVATAPPSLPQQRIFFFFPWKYHWFISVEISWRYHTGITACVYSHRSDTHNSLLHLDSQSPRGFLEGFSSGHSSLRDLEGGRYTWCQLG